MAEINHSGLSHEFLMRANLSFGRCEQLLEAAIWATQPKTVQIRSPQGKWRKNLMTLLRQELELTKVLPTGSWTHGTAIAGFSDWDYFLVLKGQSNELPSNVISRLSRALQFNMESFVEWGVDRPAIQVIDPFDNSQLDLVPAFCSSPHEYQIPNSLQNVWMPSNPNAHAVFLNHADKRVTDLIPLIRLMKCWKYTNVVPISSLYLEMKTSSFALNGRSETRLEDFVHILKSIYRDQLQPIQDPSIQEERMLSAIASDTVSTSDVLKVISSSIDLGHRLDAAEKSRASDSVDKYFNYLLPGVMSQSGWGRRPYLRSYDHKYRDARRK